MEMHVDVWIIHSKHKILVTDAPGPPMSVCGYVSEEAKQAAETRGFPTISEIGFDPEIHKGFEDSAEACAWAEERAKELAYRVDESWVFAPWADGGDEEDCEEGYDYTDDEDDWEEDEPWWGEQGDDED